MILIRTCVYLQISRKLCYRGSKEIKTRIGIANEKKVALCATKQNSKKACYVSKQGGMFGIYNILKLDINYWSE